MKTRYKTTKIAANVVPGAYLTITDTRSDKVVFCSTHTSMKDRGKSAERQVAEALKKLVKENS